MRRGQRVENLVGTNIENGHPWFEKLFNEEAFCIFKCAVE